MRVRCVAIAKPDKNRMIPWEYYGEVETGECGCVGCRVKGDRRRTSAWALALISANSFERIEIRIVMSKTLHKAA